MNDPHMRTPLGRVYGLGSARDGAGAWWGMRLSSIALVPLSLWWVIAIIAHAGADYAEFRHWVASPVPAILLILTLGVTCYHLAHGVQEVVEDYVHTEAAKIAILIAVKFGAVVLAVAGIFSVLRIAFGS
ncbi:MAG TPA: succinate dehydrogenase, hydrophobic membrane anchor protein [Aliidongia sp.]|nr:succinate dehydrogenase, hydrophobic membrane anchor protein [Aliidongia sp.]